MSLFFKHKRTNEVVDATNYLSGKYVATLMIRESSPSFKDDDESYKIKRYHGLIDILQSNDFYILTEDSLNEKELRLLINILLKNMHLENDEIAIHKLYKKLTKLYYSKKYIETNAKIITFPNYDNIK